MTHPIEFGIYLPQIAVTYDDVLGRARTCEELGYTSFWLFDHLYGPGRPDLAAFEGWTLATAILAQTTRLRVGHLVVCNNFRHPALLAKMATTLDIISGGRLDFGIGSGSVEAEHDEAGFDWADMATRSERLGEALEIITRMFTGEPTSFAGRHYRVHDLPNVPPPVQQPGPPIVVGGAGPRWTLPLVARYADVWNVPTYALASLDDASTALDRACDRIGRDPMSIRRSVEAVLVIADDEERLAAAASVAERRYGGAGFGLREGGFIGTPEGIMARIDELVARGFTHFVFFVHDRGGRESLELFADKVMARYR